MLIRTTHNYYGLDKAKYETNVLSSCAKVVMWQILNLLRPDQDDVWNFIILGPHRIS